MRYDPISTLLSTVNSTAGRVIVFGAAVWLGSAIPQAFMDGVSLEAIMFGSVLNFIAACVYWDSMGWLALLAIPGLIVYFRRFLMGEDSKRDLFVGFSISFFLFISLPHAAGRAIFPLLIYVVAAIGYWVLPKLLAKLPAWRRLR